MTLWHKFCILVTSEYSEVRKEGHEPFIHPEVSGS